MPSPSPSRSRRRDRDRRRGVALSGALPDGAARLARGGMGRVRARPPGQALSAHAPGTRAAGGRNRSLASVRRASRRSCSHNETVAAFVVVACPDRPGGRGGDWPFTSRCAGAMDEALARGAPTCEPRAPGLTLSICGRKRDREMRLTQWLDELRPTSALQFGRCGRPWLHLRRHADAGAWHRRQQRDFRTGRRHAAAPAAVPGLRTGRGPDGALGRGAPLPLSPPTLRDVREQSRSFEALAASPTGAGGGPLVTAPDGTVETVERQDVTTGFFEVLGVAPVAGRTFRPVTRGRGRPWSSSARACGGRASRQTSPLIGQTVRLNGGRSRSSAWSPTGSADASRPDVDADAAGPGTGPARQPRSSRSSAA